MADRILYKYLDAKGGLAMLEHHNLQFTNATKFNDPFDCHPALFDYSKPPANERNWPLTDFPKNENEVIDWKEVRAYPTLGEECFDSLYIGIRVDKEYRENIIRAARTCNPNIKIYQMTTDPESFMLTGKMIGG